MLNQLKIPHLFIASILSAMPLLCSAMKTPHAQKNTFQTYSAPAARQTFLVHKIPFKFLSEYRPLTLQEAQTVQALILLSQGQVVQKNKK